MNPLELLGIGGKIIDKLFPDKNERDKHKVALAELQQKGELQELETRMSAILAEAKSKDPWTSRARPSFMYVIYIMILVAIPMGILTAFNPEAAKNVSQGMQDWLAAIPNAMWATFTAGYLGYNVARSVDKGRLDKLKSKAGL